MLRTAYKNKQETHHKETAPTHTYEPLRVQRWTLNSHQHMWLFHEHKMRPTAVQHISLEQLSI